MAVTSDRDVFDWFHASGASPGVARLAFASYFEAKCDWERHRTALDGKSPSQGEVDRWIRDHSDARLESILTAAVGYFDEAANDYLAVQIETERHEAVNRSILGEVKSIRSDVMALTSFRSTFWPNLFIGIIASFAFAFIVVVASVIFEKDPSPFAFFKGAQPLLAGPAPKPQTNRSNPVPDEDLPDNLKNLKAQPSASRNR